MPEAFVLRIGSARRASSSYRTHRFRGKSKSVLAMAHRCHQSPTSRRSNQPITPFRCPQHRNWSARYRRAMESTGQQGLSDSAASHIHVTRQDLAGSVLDQRPESDRQYIAQLLRDLQAGPTPYHAVARAADHLEGAGFRRVQLVEELPAESGAYFVSSGGSLTAWIQPGQATPETSFTIVGAHTDSPNLRVKGNADMEGSGYHQLNLEVYGGVLTNSWLNRDLGVAGRMIYEGDDGELTEVLVSVDDAILTVPQLAIHLDRDVNRNGLTLNPQKHLKPIWTLNEDLSSGESDKHESANEPDDAGRFVRFMAQIAGIAPEQVMSWDLMAFDLQQPALVGGDQEFIASARIDNLLSSFAGVHALVGVHANAAAAPNSVPVLVLYDHEEIGSESATGAAGAFLASLLERIGGSMGMSRAEFLASCHRSMVLSADGAHATHPNYPDRHDPTHNIKMNGGIAIKRNANQRYATEAISESFIRQICRQHDIPHQLYHHRNDLPCGSTIGPITAARLGIPTVDLGAPQLSMHSIRETTGTLDAIHLRDTLAAGWMTPSPRP